MSLYDDLGVGASDTKTEGWSKNFKLLQSQLKVKKAALTQAKVKTACPCTSTQDKHPNHTVQTGITVATPYKVCVWISGH